MSGLSGSRMATERRVCNSLHTRILCAALLASLCITLFAPPVQASQTSTYTFLPYKSTITQTGGIAGIRRTYRITGTFQLTADFDAGTASFDGVDANAVDDSPFRHTLDPNEVFNMTGLAGVIIDRSTIRFEGAADDGSSILITLTFADGPVTLKGGTTPPPNSADFFVFALDAQAARAGQTSAYGFVPDKSTLTQTGGIAGIHRTYAITGTFLLTLDFEAGTASFGRVDANAVDDSPDQHTLDPNAVFNMTELAGVIIDRTTIQFEGAADDGSNVLITLTLADGSVTLKGGTTPPPNSADMFSYALDAVAQRKYAGGVGEPNDPYQIATAADLITLGETPEDYDKHFILTADIDLDPNLPGGKGFDRAVIAPDVNQTKWGIGGTPFTGVLDGNGYTISDLTTNGSGYLGLFGWLTGKVKDLGVVRVNVRGSEDCVAGLAGVSHGTIAGCYASGAVSGRMDVGGLVGQNGDWWSNRFEGWSFPGYIDNSYSDCDVVGVTRVGGLVGFNYAGKVTRCYSSGIISGNEQSGGLIGKNDAQVTYCFWDVETSGLTVSAGGIGKTTAEMQKAKTFLDAGWDFVGETANGAEDLWWILEGKDYPRLAWQLPADDFEDGKAGPLWMLYQPEPERVRLKEVNGRLEVEAIAQSENVDAIYAAEGWRLDATKPFAIKVDFHFSPQSGGNGRVTFGIVPSLDPSAMQWAELEAGCFESGPFYLYEVRDGSWVQEVVADRSSDGGTLYMSYDPAADELYFSHTGYGKANAWQTVTGLLKGRWASTPVYVILGGGSEGMALSGADAWLDNFAVSSGALILN